MYDLFKYLIPWRYYSMKEEFESFESALDDEDWGLIIGKDGTLKGMFIPDGQDEESIPENIVKICKELFGVDITADEEITLH